MSLCMAEEREWLIELLPFIRHLANSEYRRYPIECVQSADDIINDAALELISYVDRRARIPSRSSLENKVRLIIRRIIQGNSRLGLVARDGCELPGAESWQGEEDRE